MAKTGQIKKNISSQAFFTFFLCIIAFRLSFTENISVESLSIPGLFYDNLLSISISCALLLAAILWFVIFLWNRNQDYKYTGLEFGILLFTAAACISIYFASNKRVAMNDALTIIAIMLSSVILCQIIDSEAKRKILLFAIIAMGIANVYQCSDQFLSGNKLMIEEYKNNPEQQLQRLGIEPDSFQQMQYEHRLYSKDVKGFFTTSNSVGSLLNIAIFSVIAVFGPGLKKFRQQSLKTVAFPAIIVLVLFAGLLMSASKGALLSFALAGFALLIYVLFAKFLKAHKIFIFFVVTAGLIATVLLTISYGLRHNTLPGGNSMLVRWQYWAATAKMIADHFFTGVGGGNFGTYYTQYKTPGALETIRDPHCFLLSILSSYGIVGLAGFCSALFIPILRALKTANEPLSSDKNDITALMFRYGTLAVIFLLFLRPLAVRSELGSQFTVAVYVIVFLYIAPVFFFATTLWLCTRSKENYDNSAVWTAPLLCGIFAVLVHNLIDFAIFEPGIMAAMWAILAIIISQHSDSHIVSVRPSSKYIFTILAAALATVLLWIYIVPVANTALKTEEAKKLTYYGELSKASAILTQATTDDPLSPTPTAFKGKILLQKFKMNPSLGKDILLQAASATQIAIDRDPADYKNYETLADIYQTLAKAVPQQYLFWFKKAFESLNHAVSLYPSSAEIHLTLATVAQQLNKTDYAIDNYTQAIAIEDAYTKQFKIMYPHRTVFSRLGEINYKFAKERLEQLTQGVQNKGK